MNRLLVFLLIIITFWSCNQNKDDTIKIGAILPLTGNAADYGKKTQKGIELALQEINKSGGVSGKKIEIIYEDDKLKKEEGLSAFQKLKYSYDIQSILGPVSSGVVLSIAPEANRKKVVILSTYASNSKITNAGDYIFRIYPSDSIQADLDARFAFNYLEYTKGAILYINSDYGIGLKNTFKNRFRALGGEILITESFQEDKTDFRTQLQKIKSTKSQFIFMPGNAKEMALILIQAKELNIDKQFISTDSFLETTVLDNAGDAANRVYFSAPKEDKDIELTKFYSDFQEKFKMKPGLLEALGYDGLKVLTKAINKRGNYSDSIKASLYDIKNFNGITGKISFDSNGDISRKFVIKKIVNSDITKIDF